MRVREKVLRRQSQKNNIIRKINHKYNDALTCSQQCVEKNRVQIIDLFHILFKPYYDVFVLLYVIKVIRRHAD